MNIGRMLVYGDSLTKVKCTSCTMLDIKLNKFRKVFESYKKHWIKKLLTLVFP